MEFVICNQIGVSCMRTVVDSQGKKIGEFDGNTVKDKTGNVIYLILDGEVFVPTDYEEDLKIFNKGQFSAIGEFDGQYCTSNNEIVLEIK